MSELDRATEPGAGPSGNGAGPSSNGAATGATRVDRQVGRTSSVDRHAAFAAGRPKLERKYVWWMVGFVLVLGLGGTLAEHLVSAAGLNPTTPKPSSTVPPTTVLPGAPSISSPLPAFMGLVPERPISGYNFSLVDETGAPLSLGDERGKVVVLSFFDGRCDDICPVLASELRAADRDLGSAAKHVVFLTVNSDPGATAVADLAPAVRATRLSSLGNWHLLTGPLSELNTVWTHYGLQVTMVSKTGMVAHNDVIYFVDPDGHLRYQATPFANESRSGVYQLPGADIARFGSGIALYASRLVRSP